MYFDCTFQKSDIHFRRPETKTFDNPRKIFSRIIGGFRYLLTKMDIGFRFRRSKNPWRVSHLFRKFPLSWKFRVDNTGCHTITITEERITASKREFFLLFFIKGSVFWSAKFKSDVHFCRPDRKISIIQKKRKNFFLDYQEYQIQRESFLEAGCDGTLSAPTALHFVRIVKIIPFTKLIALIASLLTLAKKAREWKTASKNTGEI